MHTLARSTLFFIIVVEAHGVCFLWEKKRSLQQCLPGTHFTDMSHREQRSQRDFTLNSESHSSTTPRSEPSIFLRDPPSAAWWAKRDRRGQRGEIKGEQQRRGHMAAVHNMSQQRHEEVHECFSMFEPVYVTARILHFTWTIYQRSPSCFYFRKCLVNTHRSFSSVYHGMQNNVQGLEAVLVFTVNSQVTFEMYAGQSTVWAPVQQVNRLKYKVW